MHILIVNKLYSPWLGGMETIVQQLAEGLPQKDSTITTTVLCCQPRGQGTMETINGVTVVKASSWGRLWKMPVSFSFFRYFKTLSREADIIDLHHPFPLGFLAYLLFKPKGKLVVHYHADIILQRVSAWLIQPLLKHVLKRAHTIVVSNPNLVKSSPLLSSYPEKCVVIPFGIEYERLHQAIAPGAVNEIKQKYGKYVLFVGRLSYYKGVEYLLEAIRTLPYTVVIIGEGEERGRLNYRIQQLGIEQRVVFLPPQPYEQLANFYAAAEVFVLPSVARSEAYGLVLLEAMACGTPVISTELGTGTSFVNQHQVTGFVVPPRDPRALAETIKHIMNNPEEYKKFSEQARARVEKLFTLDRMIEEHATLCKNL